tara:strand:+ start:1071 stop:2189 length:1119 start_codon:yes stop_codon:yes gene_type:complete
VKKVVFVIASHSQGSGKTGITGPERRVLRMLPYLKNNGWSTVVVCPPQCKLKDAYKNESDEYYEFAIKSKFSIYQVKNLIDIIRQTSSKIIISHGPASLDFFIALASLFIKFNHIVARPVLIFDQTNYTTLKKIIYQTFDLFTLNRATSIITITDRAKKHLEQFTIKGSKILLIYNGVPVASKRKIHLKQDVLKILMAAQFSEVKGWDYLVDTVHSLKNQGVKISCMAAGEGLMLNEVKEKVKSLGLAQEFNFLGHVENIYEELQKVDIFILTSKREGMSVAILEAMANGLPVISSDVGGIREQVLNDYEGYVVPIGDVGGYANSVKKLIDYSKRDLFGKRAYDKAKEKFDQNRMAFEYLKLMERVNDSQRK